MRKKKAPGPKKETSRKKRYKKPVLRRMEMKVPYVGFARSPDICL